MKKIVTICLSALIILSLSSCGQRSALQKATGASAKQNQQINRVLEAAGIQYEIITGETELPNVSIPQKCKAYTLIEKNKDNYYLILDNNMQVVALLDDDNNILVGSLS